jgi:MSHA pilin protein MshC
MQGGATAFPERGFTIIELVIVMVVVGILAVFASSKFADRADFQARGFQDETRSLLRYAQKSAIAQRRAVCVALNATGVVLTIDTNTPGDNNCDGPLTLPSASQGGAGLVPSVTNFKFLPLGDTDQVADVTAYIPDVTIQVDFRNGYVR